MPNPAGTYHRIKTYASGKKVRLTIAPNGRILETTPVRSRVKKTSTAKRLAKRRRRIGTR